MDLSIRAWLDNRIVKRSLIDDAKWQNAFQRLSLFHYLSEEERERLKRLAILFLHYKSLEPVGNLKLSLSMQVEIALQACLLILKLGLDWYKGWVSVVVYPSGFSKQSTEVDECGIVHQGRISLSGESWQQGPVIISLDRSQTSEGSNVIIHEFAHKLDMLNGQANGFPPLHKDISAQRWSEVFNKAFDDFKRNLEERNPVPINPYAATSPAEFFAVFSELFFEKPKIIRQYYPDVYELLVKFYRQNPLPGKALTQ